MGLGGIVYVVIVARRQRIQTTYQLVFEDWLFHAVLPFGAYATLSATAYAARAHPTECLFGVATAALLLLFIGIHNAWDAVTYHIFVSKPKLDKAKQSQ